MGTRAAILLSRQPLRPAATTPWVRQTLAALEWIRSENLTLISSVGMLTWELILAAASLRAIPQLVLLPVYSTTEPDRSSRVRSAFALDDSSALRFINGDTRRQFMAARDTAAFELADVLIPISLLPDGSMFRRLHDRRAAGRTIIDRFAIPWKTREQPLKYSIPDCDLNPGLDELSPTYVIHWTRSANSPWPDERPIDFYRSILASPCYPRSAFHTLARMLTTRRLIASGRHLPRGARAVAFSSLTPRQVLPLMQWRARYREMSFEPYGIGIETSAARELGIRPVHYYDPDKDEIPSPEQLWCSQSVGTRTDWTREAEYRHRGDLDLNDLPPESLLAFCFRPSEAGELVRATGVPCIPLLTRDFPVSP